MRTRLLVGVSVLFGWSLAASAGWEFTSVTRTEGEQGRGAGAGTSKAWINGDKARIEFVEGKNPMMEKGSYMLTQDGGQTIYMVDPGEKTYAKWDVDGIVKMAGGMMGMMGMTVSDPKVEKVIEEKGESIAGFPTTHYKIRSSHTMEMGIFGMKQKTKVQSEEEIWATTKVGDLGQGLWAKTRSMKSGNEQLDKLTAAQRDQVKGFPLKQISISKNIDADGKEETTKTIMEVTEIKKSSPDASLFEIPKGFKEQSMMGAPAEAGEEGTKKTEPGQSQQQPAPSLKDLFKSFKPRPAN